MWPVTSHASVGGDPGAPPSGGSPLGPAVGVAQVFSERGSGSHAGDLNPDMRDVVDDPGRVWVVLTPPEPFSEALDGADGIDTSNCTPSRSDSAWSDLPSTSMTIGSAPDAPELTGGADQPGRGGVVNLASWFWVVGWHGELSVGEPATVSVTNCLLQGNALVPDTHVTTAYLQVSSNDQPDWTFGDNADGDTGWGRTDTGDVQHTYRVSSARCDRAFADCVRVPGQVPEYVVTFTVQRQVQLVLNGAASEVPIGTSSRHRGFPVREVQSVLDR
jgi:hypothetical protein